MATVQQAPVITAAPAGLEAQFKSRKVTYNRPPQKLALDKAEQLPLGATVNVLAAQLPASQAGALKLLDSKAARTSRLY